MPELPEVETVRRGLEERVVGRRITAVEVGRERTVRRTSREALVAGLTGTTMLAAGRHGKYLVCPLDSGDAVMIHLRMSGQLLIAPEGAARPPHTHVVAHLDGAAPEELWFVDPRTFGEVVVFAPTRVDVELPELAQLGVDPIADGLDRALLRSLLLARRRQLKPLLLDQHVIAGIGNIYVDEILHLARLHPLRTSETLSGQEITRLHAAIHDVLGAAIDSGGSTLGDNQYVDLMGSGGSYQDDHRVYDRAGQRCATCGTGIIVRIPFG
ncbi:MAG: bifunctional DNA-formamidopyrimidine glycosylase/DNA-(apurinic or apyrimidinic site) lyase, partial [Acidimicrobiia bacterium]